MSHNPERYVSTGRNEKTRQEIGDWWHIIIDYNSPNMFDALQVDVAVLYTFFPMFNQTLQGEGF